ncbi:hypothetical protein K491DRAFT_90971 [Lophiostoma macrostomum CBS 122681]|uniref:Uncharacterized protein n=1 Tax=Lophiostoma macrostomum CBS 122681 TaxID=1314788 RepID=A0A6A6TNG0_9PLEO|nr:hypothetical protein K491DRAFT_90971 [Lophiostoma macrostomum CBS 122681]
MAETPTRQDQVSDVWKPAGLGKLRMWPMARRDRGAPPEGSWSSPSGYVTDPRKRKGYACQGRDGEQRSRRGAETKLGHCFRWRKGTIGTAAGRVTGGGATEVYM